MTQEIIIIENLKCGGCANTITKQLQKMIGVETVQVDVENSKVIIERSKALSRESLIEKLSKLGYPELGNSNGLMKKAKSYVSCAIGRIDS